MSGKNQFAAVAAPPDRGLDSALQALHPGPWLLRAQRPGGGCQRAELPLAAADPLAFLRHFATADLLPAGGCSYWSDRSHSLQSAGVGTAAEVSGNDATPFAEVCGQVRRLIGCRRQRLYGGFSFASPRSARHDEPLWEPFGSYRFTLPRVELTRGAAGTVLACNFRADERDTLGAALRDLAGRCQEAVRAALAGPASLEGPVIPVGTRIHVPDQLRWRQIVETMLRRLGSHLDGAREPLQKIVLARRTTFEFAAPICVLTLLQRLRIVNPAAYHFALQPRPGMAFFGASPERLLRISGATLETEALAGTRPRGTSAAADAYLEGELLGSDKELREHRFVHTSIAEDLHELCTQVTTQDAVRVRKLAHVQHLHTSFTGTLKAGVGVADALQRLHPTPAVGGYPKPGVSDLIAATEAFDRGWYAGPVGWIGAAAAEFAVGIRSGVAAGNTLHLYAGNGIVRGSAADAEWAEMEQKILQILDVV